MSELSRVSSAVWCLVLGAATGLVLGAAAGAAKEWFGHGVGRSPCAQSIGKFSLC